MFFLIILMFLCFSIDDFVFVGGCLVLGDVLLKSQSCFCCVRVSVHVSWGANCDFQHGLVAGFFV